MLGDWTYTAVRPIIETNERGFAAFKCFVPMPIEDAFWYYEQPPTRHLRIRDGIDTAFAGRLEDRAVVDGGLQVTAMGFQRAFSDIPYTALWSDTSYGRWRVVTDDERADTTADMWRQDKDNRLYIAPRKGEEIAGTDACEMTYSAPHGGLRGLTAMTFTYDIDLPADWEMNVYTADYDFGNPTLVDTLASSGSPLTGTVTWSLLDDLGVSQQRIIVQVINNTGSPVTITDDTGDNYVKLSDVRIVTADTPITADTIASHLANYINGINPNQALSASPFNIEAGSIDLESILYEDTYPADILNELIEQAAAGQRWQWSVWENRRLQFYPRGSRAQTWYTDVTGLNVSGTLDTLRNSVYGTYQNGFGEIERTAVNTDSNSVETYGITRQGLVNAGTTAQAEQKRDLLLTEMADITPRSRVKLNGLYNAEGASFPLWYCRAGDTITIRNLPISYSPAIDKIRTFYVTSTRYDLENDELNPTPGDAPLGLDILVGNITPRRPGVRLAR